MENNRGMADNRGKCYYFLTISWRDVFGSGTREFLATNFQCGIDIEPEIVKTIIKKIWEKNKTEATAILKLTDSKY